MSKHTPGPWKVVPQSNGSALVAHEFETGNQMTPMGLRLVCTTLARTSSLPEDKANARLIAAAPELLAALKELADDFHKYADLSICPPGRLAKAASAITRAEGGVA